MTPYGIHCVRQTALMNLSSLLLQDAKDVLPKYVPLRKKGSSMSRSGTDPR